MQVPRAAMAWAQESFGRCELGAQQPPAKAGGLGLRTESPDTRRLNDASYSGSILKSSFGFGSK